MTETETAVAVGSAVVRVTVAKEMLQWLTRSCKQNLEGSSLNRSPRWWRWTSTPRGGNNDMGMGTLYGFPKKDRNLLQLLCANAVSLKHMAGQADAPARGDFLGRGQEWKSFWQVEN